MFDFILLIPTLILWVLDWGVPAHSLEANLLALAMGIWLITANIMCDAYDDFNCRTAHLLRRRSSRGNGNRGDVCMFIFSKYEDTK